MSILAITAVLGAALPQDAKPPLPTFAIVTKEAGITFNHGFGDHELSNIVEGTGPGGAFLDYDGDGFLDVYLVNGSWRREVSDNQGRDLRGKLVNALFRNRGDGTFEDVTAKAGVGDQGFGMGVSAADYDGDGDLDLYVLNYDANVLYRNEGDGTFSDVSKESGLADPSWSVSAPWLDYDGDGDLDVYVVNYLLYDDGRFRDYYAAAGYPGPLSYNGQTDRLYRNNGDGTFTDVTEEAGLLDPRGRGMSAIACDLTGDGRRDLYVANDATANFFYVAQEDGTFQERALLTGLAFGEGGQGASSMGPVVGDVDRDGTLDVYVPDMGYGCLLLNRKKVFEDVTQPWGVAVACGQYVGWGAALFDFDNDGWLDLFVANGNAHHEYTQEDVLLRNNGRGGFVDVAKSSGPYFNGVKLVNRGAAQGDFDNDGDVDLLISTLHGAPVLLRNDGGTNHWLTVVPRLETGAIAIGAVVTTTLGKVKLIREVAGVTGYLSRSDPRAHFGLGAATSADSVEIRWPDGTTTRRSDVPADRFLTVVKGAE